MKVVVTGAAGKLGSATVAALLRRGHEVVATDAKYRGDLGVPLTPKNLLDEHALYPLLEGAQALVHLGNHPNRFNGPSPQRLLAENVAMNAYAFNAALDLGLEHIVFASSVQVTVQSDGVRADPKGLPYLPLDGDAPQNPGLNPYAQSKQLGEELLKVAAQARPALAATVLRYPMIVGDWLRQRVLAANGKVQRDALYLGEATAYLSFEDAAELVGGVLERAKPGYHQYFPAQTLRVENVELAALIERFYPGVPLRRPLEQIQTLVDISALERDLGWRPRERLGVELVEE
ncbi:MAG TPA: NAD(P)-dependent oxidoreductase [Polyangiaceae bacterium]